MDHLLEAQRLLVLRRTRGDRGGGTRSRAELEETRLFFCELYEQEFDETDGVWVDFVPESFTTQVIVPPKRVLDGYDVVSYSCGTSAECSPLSCNHLASEVDTNSHCLLASLEHAKQLLGGGLFTGSEPGPFRVVAVYSVPWPHDPR